MYLQKGLIHPTPRAVKRLLNAIRPKLRAKLEGDKFQTHDEDIRRIIKEEVLAYSWPSFYQDYFHASVQGKHQGLTKRWSQLEAACRAYELEAIRDKIDPDKEKLEFSLRRLRETYRDEQFMNPIDYRLVSFLAEPPYWVYAPKESDAGDLEDAIPPPAASGFQFGSTDLNPMAKEDADNQFMQLYYSGQSEPDPQKKLELFRAAAELAYTHLPQIPTHRADEIGNMAVDAERFRAYSFADQLFRFALVMRPKHPNNMQNYVSFILDREQTASYPEAERLLAVLEGQHGDFKPERTLALSVQLSALKGEHLVPTDQQIDGICAKLRSSPTDFSIYGNALLLATRIGNLELARQLLEIACDPAYVDSPKYLYLRLRSFADAIASQRELGEKRLQAMEIYRWLLELKPIFDLSPTDEAVIRHNYATLLFTFDYDDYAGEMWYEAYRLAPSDPAIRSAYSSYVARTNNRQDVFAKIMAGEALTESDKVLWPLNKVVPSSFSDESYIKDIFRRFVKP